MKVKHTQRIFLMIWTLCLLAGCGSTSQVDNAGRTEEMTAKELLKTDYRIEAGKGVTQLIVKDVYLTIRRNEETGNKIQSSSSDYETDNCVYPSLLDDYFATNPSLVECIEEYRKYTVYINLSKTGNSFFGYDYHFKIEKIETFRTIEEINAAKEAKANQVRSDYEKAITEFDKRVKENHSAVDSKGKQIAKGYVYHGYSEADDNKRIFVGGAMEKGHAYLIVNCIPSASGNYIKCGNKTVWIDYANNNVKQDVVLRKNTDAVIVVTKSGTTSVVLGLVADGYERTNTYGLYEEFGYDTSKEAVSYMSKSILDEINSFVYFWNVTK